MAKIGTKNPIATERITKFGGICHIGTEKGERSAYDICNFRILPNGSLLKREGFAPIMTLSGEPRAFISGCFDGDRSAFALVGSAVYLLELENGSAELIGNVDSSVGKAEFFIYEGSLYLVDGNELYRYLPDGFIKVRGYVPLFGKERSGDFEDEVYEPLNFLSDKIRIQYHLTSEKNRLYIGVQCSEILSLIINGNESKGSASLSKDGLWIFLTSRASEDTIIDVCLSLSEANTGRSQLTCNKRAVYCGGDERGRIILYGGNKASRIYASRPVDFESYIESQRFDVGSEGIYFPVDGVVEVGSEGCPISAVCVSEKKLLALNDHGIYSVTFKSGNNTPIVTDFCLGIGCESEAGAAFCGDELYFIAHSGIYRISETGGAECISFGIEDMLDDEFYQHSVAFYNESKGEMWFADPYSEDQSVFIYSITGGEWYRFDGIPFDLFFLQGNDVAMLYGKYIFAFSENQLVDVSAEGAMNSPIEAYYESNVTDFGYPSIKKHLGRVLIKAELDGDPIHIKLQGDLGGNRNIQVKPSGLENGKYPTDFHTLGGIGSFCSMNYIISSASVGRTKILGLTLSAL